jgi:hypothetical protein
VTVLLVVVDPLLIVEVIAELLVRVEYVVVEDPVELLLLVVIPDWVVIVDALVLVP